MTQGRLLVASETNKCTEILFTHQVQTNFVLKSAMVQMFRRE